MNKTTGAATPGEPPRLTAHAESLLGALASHPAGRAGNAALVDAFFAQMQRHPPQVFCDIGANKGGAGQRALATCPGITVFGFEANPEIHALYASANRSAGVNWINAAVSDRTGTLTLHIPRVLERAFRKGRFVAKRHVEPADTGKSSILRRDENAEYTSIDVPSVTLDAYLHDHAPQGRVTLWIDVEGAASLVLAGATQTLARTDLLVIEMEGFAFWKDQTLAAQILTLLRSHGLVPVLRDREFDDLQFNTVFIRAGQPAQDILAPARIAATGTTPAPATTPVLVPCFNNPSYCEQMLSQLARLGFADITFIDNASTSPAMHDWLAGAARSGARVERLPENLGPRKSVFTAARLAALPRHFCVTDPDLSFNPALPPDFLALMAAQMEEHDIGKIGFALDISDRAALRDDSFQIKAKRHYKIWEWEEQFWQDRCGLSPLGDPVYRAIVDTTFALHDTTRYAEKRFFKALRIAGRFTAQHLPWLQGHSMPAAEFATYRDTQKHSYYIGASPVARP